MNYIDVPFELLDDSNEEILLNATSIVYDIETVPLPIDQLIAISPFDEKKVKYGNRKSEDSRSSHLEEARREHVSKLREGAALDSLLSKVAAIGYGIILENEFKIILDDRNEQDMIETWWNIASKKSLAIGHNSDKFDLPYLIQRTFISDVLSVPGWARKVTGNRTFFDQRFVDLMPRFTINPNEYVSLNKLGAAMGLGKKKEIDGLYYEVYRRNIREAHSYLAGDIDLTCRIAFRMGVV